MTTISKRDRGGKENSSPRPKIVLDLSDQLVVLKPAGWEVHDDSPGAKALQLRQCLKDSLGMLPILDDPGSQFSRILHECLNRLRKKHGAFA